MLRKRAYTPFILGNIFLTLGLAAADASAASLLVLSKGDHTLSVVDPSTQKIVAHMPSGPDPHEVIASADGTLAYISNYGAGAYNTLTVVDLVTHQPVTTVDLGPLHGPHGLAEGGGKIWFTAEAAKAIASYDPEQKKVDWILGTGQNRTHMLWVSDSLQQIITSNISSATLSVIEKVKAPAGAGNSHARTGAPGGEWDQTLISVGRGAEGFDVSPDRREVWAANALDGTVSVVDMASKKVVATLPADVNGANRLKFTPDGKAVLVSTLRGPDLVILDAHTRQVMKRLPIGHGAAGIQMQPDGSVAYVSCTPDDYVTIIDLHSFAVKGHLTAGKQPDGLAWAAR